MCTALTMQTSDGETFFGRTMDFSYPLDPHVYVMSKGYEWYNYQNTAKFRNRYSFIGIGQDITKIILADGMNEKGFAAAALYFPGYAVFDETDHSTDNPSEVAALELVNFMLGMCATVKDAAAILKSIRIVGVSDPVTRSVARCIGLYAIKKETVW